MTDQSLSRAKLFGNGEARRRRELTLGPAGPWRATVTIDAVETNHGRHSTAPFDWIFEVGVEWTGPPAFGFPPSPQPVQARDAYVVPHLEHARVLARRALDAFAHPGEEPPDLRDLAGVTSTPK